MIIHSPISAKRMQERPGRIDFSVTVVSGSGEFPPLESLATGPAVVWLEVEQGLAEPGGGNGKWKLSRGGDVSQPLTVGVALAGSAAAYPGSFALTPSLGAASRLTFPANERSLEVSVAALDDGSNHPDRQLELQIVSADGYQILQPLVFRVVHVIGHPEVSVESTHPIADEQGPSGGAFEFTRFSHGLLENELLVTFRLSGTADTKGSDYTVEGAQSYDPLSGEGTVRFGFGEAKVSLSILPVADGIKEDDETVLCEILPGTGYLLHEVFSASLVIKDYTVTHVLAQAFFSGHPFPIEGKTLHFVPQAAQDPGSHGYYAAFISEATVFPTTIPSSHDSTVWESAGWSVWGNPQAGESWRIEQTFQFLGNAYWRAYVNANGTISFGSPNGSNPWSWDAFFLQGRPLVAGYWANLAPSEGGVIAHRYLTDAGKSRHVVTVYEVPLQGSENVVSFQIEFFSGSDAPVRLTHLGTTAATSTVVGISPGTGWPENWQMTSFAHLPAFAVLPTGYLTWVSLMPAHARGLRDQPFQDGVPNLLRFVFGLPTDGPTTMPDFTAPKGSPHQFELTLPSIFGDDELNLTAELSSDMVNWVNAMTVADLAFELSEQGFRVMFTPNQGWPFSFFRIKVEPTTAE